MSVEVAEASQVSRKVSIASICVAHCLNDWYMNYIQTLLPFMVAAGLGISKGAFLVSAFTVTSSLFQPVSGYLVDQKDQRWLVYAGTLWMAVLLSLIGVLKSYPLLVALVTLAGFGTAAFHPQASAMISSLGGNRKGFFQAVFITSGNVGWALTPLLAVPFIETWGLEWTPLFVLPGVVVSVVLRFTVPETPSRKKASPPPLWPALRPVRFELSKVVAVVAFRSLAFFSMVAFLPLYLQHRDISLLTGSRLVFLMLFSGAIGGLVGGHLSDLLGRKTVIAGSLMAATPLFYLFLQTDGLPSYILLALAGAALLASFSVTIVAAQEVIAENAAMAAGLMLGFGIGIGGLGVGLVGMAAERFGIEFAIRMLVWLPFAAGLLSLAMRRRPEAGNQELEA